VSEASLRDQRRDSLRPRDGHLRHRASAVRLTSDSGCRAHERASATPAASSAEMHVVVNGVAASSTSRARPRPRRPRDAREADAPPAPRWPGLDHSIYKPAFSPCRYHAGRCSSPSRQRPQRSRSAGELDPGPVGRRRARVLRDARIAARTMVYGASFGARLALAVRTAIRPIRRS